MWLLKKDKSNIEKNQLMWYFNNVDNIETTIYNIIIN